MSTARRNTLLALILAAAAGLSGGAWWLIRAPEPTVSMPVEPPAPQDPQPISVPPVDIGGADRGPELDFPTEAESSPETTVVYPLEIDLEIQRASLTPHVEGVDPLGSGATARIRGSIRGEGGAGARAEVRFVAGPNSGRVLYGLSNGSFGANDLHPGLSIAQVTAPGTPGSLREVRLRKDRDTELNIGYGRPAVVHGQIVDGKGQGVADAKVSMDGQETQSDERGEFVFPRMTSGEVLVLVEKPGFAACRGNVTVPAGQTIEKGRLKYVLRTAARLRISVEEPIERRNPALVFILTENMGAQRRFPWFRVNPVHVWPGGTETVEDLPPEHVTLRVFHAGAVGKPPSRSVGLREGETVEVTLHIEAVPALVGVVTQAGQPVENAEVVLEAPERSRAMLSVLGESNYLFLEGEVLPDLPPAHQTVRTNVAGEFQLSSGEQVSKERYLHARSPDGKSTAWKLLRGGETRVDLELERQEQGDGEVIFQMDGRFQPLPVKVRVNNAPREPILLPAGQDLHVGGLAPGSWIVNARWNGEGLLRNLPIELRKEVTLPIALPEGAILGQDEDTRNRARKR